METGDVIMLVVLTGLVCITGTSMVGFFLIRKHPAVFLPVYDRTPSILCRVHFPKVDG